MEKLFLHLGLPKTGTTFLQKNVFPNLEGITYLDHLKNPEILGLYGKIGEENISDAECEQICEELLPKNAAGPFLISREQFSCSPINIRKKSWLDLFRDLKRIFSGNFKVCPVVTLREQSDHLISLYKQCLLMGDYRDFADFIKEKENHSLGNLPLTEWYKYSNTLDELSGLYGKKNLDIEIYNDLREDPKSFIDSLADSMGSEIRKEVFPNRVNPGLGKYQVRLAKIMNRMIRSGRNPSGIIPVKALSFPIIWPRWILQNPIGNRIFTKKYKPPQEILSRLKKKWIPDNKRLDKNYDVDLPPKYFKIS
jgi:hypothetical protein